jgi:hypothetical protein
MIVTGLDWSGNPGRGHGPWLVPAFVHVEADQFSHLDAQLANARALLRVAPGFAFKHVHASPAVHRAFYAAIRNVEFQAHILLVDKTQWSTEYLQQSTGPARICDAVIELAFACPDPIIAGQLLYVDLPRSQKRTVNEMRTALRRALTGAGRRTFEDVRPCPDHRQHGALVQVADMLAGEINEFAGLGGPFLPALGNRVKVV